MKMRRGGEDVLLATDLTERLAAYTREAGVHCRGCGSWIANDEDHVLEWGYNRRGDLSERYPYCDRCARLGIVTR